jgi:hypothetical protein
LSILVLNNAEFEFVAHLFSQVHRYRGKPKSDMYLGQFIALKAILALKASKALSRSVTYEDIVEVTVQSELGSGLTEIVLELRAEDGAEDFTFLVQPSED